MENLTDAGKKSSARSGLQKLKRIRDEMFKKRHQSLKEEDENKQNQENSPAGILFLFCITHPTRYSCVHYPKENIIRKIEVNKIKKIMYKSRVDHYLISQLCNCLHYFIFQKP